VVVADDEVSLVLELVVSWLVEESEVGVEENDELVCDGVELTCEDEGVEVAVFEEEEESLVGVADVLAGVVLPPDADELELPPSPTPDRAPDTAELTTPPCRLLKTLSSSQLACVRATNTATVDSRRIWGRENIMTLVEKVDGKSRTK
jgi:hypothetical protein